MARRDGERRILGASLIICTDILDDNLTPAAKLGAHVTLNPLRDDIVQEVRKLADNGVDISSGGGRRNRPSLQH